MNRPTITDAMKLEAARQVAEAVNGDAETIAAAYLHPMDGYELARELDRRYGWDLTRADVDELDNMESKVRRQLEAAEKAWAAKNSIEPTLPIGTRITKGVITGVCEYLAARYKVKEDGDSEEGRFLLVRFEDAVAV